MPRVAGNFCVYAVNLLATTLDDSVKADVVFERIGADNVVIVRVDNSDRDPSCLVGASGDGIEAHGNLDILRDDRLKGGK